MSSVASLSAPFLPPLFMLSLSMLSSSPLTPSVLALSPLPQPLQVRLIATRAFADMYRMFLPRNQAVPANKMFEVSRVVGGLPEEVSVCMEKQVGEGGREEERDPFWLLRAHLEAGRLRSSFHAC
jgi:hypothetical protein